jgi:uncharacterized membrane-anchored protein YitT (DUF2179 family)
VTKTQLIAVSAIRDLLDFVVVGQIPGLNWILNLPVIWLHYRFAGPRALVTLFENVPGIETLPCFTVAAISYPDHRATADPDGERRTNSKVIDAQVIDARTITSAPDERVR